MKLSKIICYLCILGSAVCLFVVLDNKTQAQSLEEKKSPTKETRDLFTSLGIEYTHSMVIDCELDKNIDVRKTELYLNNPEFYEKISKLYQNDIAENTLVPISIRWIDENVGYGAFAEKDIKKDDFIGIYTGSLQRSSLLENYDYTWEYPVKILDTDFNFSLDAAHKGNELRFFNDAPNPNCIANYIIGKNNLWNVCYIALKDIKKGEQLLVSYGPKYWNDRDYKFHNLTDE